VTTADPGTPAGSAERTQRARQAWRAWRRTRPFWGGLLIVLGGAEILSTTVLSLGPVFRVGLGGVNGFVGTVIAFVLALCGLLLWFSPAQRVFYSIVAVILALATFNTINYGGFFIGMLLGITGGALAFAWSPVTARPGAAADRQADGTDDRVNAQAGDEAMPGVQAGGRAAARAGDRSEAKIDDPAGERADDPADGKRAGGGGLSLVLGKLRQPGLRQPGHGGGREQRGRGRMLGIAALPLSLPLLLGPGWQAQRAAAPQSGPGCILIILCPPPAPTPSPSGSPSPSASPTGPASPPPGTGQPPAPSPRPTGTRSSHSAGSKNIKRTRAPGGLVAASVPTVLTAGSARLVGLAYDGVAEVPRASGRPVPMMKFSLQSVTLTGSPTLTIHQNASVATTRTSLLSFSGNVVLYATRLSGNLLGLPVTLTPSSPLSLVLRLLRPLTQGLTVTMTKVVTDQPLTIASASRWANYLISVRPV
jgi:hypothetical protein